MNTAHEPGQEPCMPPTKVLLLALASTALLLPAGLRHHFLWGGEYHQILHVLEWLCVLLFTAGTCISLHQAQRLISAGKVDTRWIWRGAFLLGLLTLVVPPFLSEDVFSYIGRGRLMALHGGNPWVDKVSELAGEDPELLIFMKSWADFPLPYGPVLAWLLAGIAWLAEQFSFLDFTGRMWLAVYLFKAINIAVFLLGGLFLSRLTANWAPRTKALTLLFYLWNPFCLLEFGANAHNDVFLITPLLWGLLEASRAHHGRAGLGLLLSSLSKFTSLALGPFFLILAWRQKALRPFLGAMLVGALVYTLSFYRFWSGPDGLSWILEQGSIQGVSLQSLAHLTLGGSRDLWKGLGLAAFGLWLLLRLPKIHQFEDLPRESAYLLALLILLALPSAFGWYQIWWLSLALLSGRTLPARYLALTIGASYSVYLLTRTLDTPHQWFAWTLALIPPILLLFRPTTPTTN